jgi:hypothetical protein
MFKIELLLRAYTRNYQYSVILTLSGVGIITPVSYRAIALFASSTTNLAKIAGVSTRNTLSRRHACVLGEILHNRSVTLFFCKLL